MYSNVVGSQKLTPTWNMMLLMKALSALSFASVARRVHRRRAIGRLELVDEHVVADAEVHRQPLRDEEAHRRAEVRLDEDVREAGELGVARNHFGLTGADAGGEEHLPRDEAVIEDGELAVHGHVVEVRAPRSSCTG